MLWQYGFSNAFWALVVVAIIIFLTSWPIGYYAARYNVDIDLLTRGAGFGYIGSPLPRSSMPVSPLSFSPLKLPSWRWHWS